MTSTRARACTGKRAFPTQETAETHRQWLIAGGTAPGSVTTYQCRFCRQWHTGHTTRRRGKKTRNP